ncbi:pentatricopeptide repeat-containing protein At1g80270, mitochondrial-like [Vigna umbellata]|uniref:pentatricopeptide repeat-containing protein At1g80270, mitochondrial-like n=1 Tax=Vigna umbellata TaxID=87088 RepID=UPI001F5F5C9A|nr:pentatricopeptide repeat-containing protein At1g80270, mitochondrial-like [Vigna umbellata]
MMWTLRRASLCLRSQRLNAGATRAPCVNLVPTTCLENERGIHQYLDISYGRFLLADVFCSTDIASLNFAVDWRGISSQAGASSTKEDDGELEGGSNDESDADFSNGDEESEKLHDELELSDDETGPTKKQSPGRQTQSELFKEIVKAHGLSIDSAIDKWVQQGKELGREEIMLAVRNLRKGKMYGRALQLFQWLESNKKLEFGERDYVSKLDLIAKLHGLQKAEKYIESVPESFRGELLYRTLLANCAGRSNIMATERIFNKMKDLNFPLTSFTCNQLLLLYKNLNKQKMADVLLLMEKENVKPCIFTYRILLDVKGQSNDIAGMEQVLETMKVEGIEPDIQIQELLAKHYTKAGLNEKAETVLKEIEGENLKENRWLCATLIRLYANLGKADEVERIWKVCESKAGIDDCLAAVEAWGKLKKIEEAESIFDRASKKWKLNSKKYSVLLMIYANNNMLKKGKDLVKRMADSGTNIGPLTWNALVKLYIEAGEVEKADSILQKAIQRYNMRPMFSTYMTILWQYSRRGDVHNSEKIFHAMRSSGYTSRISQLEALIQAYRNAKVPAYGIRERMKTDNIFPNKSVANRLVEVEAFKKKALSDLLD